MERQKKKRNNRQSDIYRGGGSGKKRKQRDEGKREREREREVRCEESEME